MSWNTRRIPDDYKQDWEWKAISRSRAFQSKNNEWELRIEADSERPASIQNAWPPAELIIARALAKVLTKPIILMQGIEATSPMLESFRVAHGIKG